MHSLNGSGVCWGEDEVGLRTGLVEARPIPSCCRARRKAAHRFGHPIIKMATAIAVVVWNRLTVCLRGAYAPPLSSNTRSISGSPVTGARSPLTRIVGVLAMPLEVASRCWS